MTGLWDHQVAALDWLATHPRAGLSIPMGGGKSRVVCEHLARVTPDLTLIVCPATVVTTWSRELNHWYPDTFEVVPLGSGLTIEARNRVLRNLEVVSRPVVVIVNLEALGLKLIERAKARAAKAQAQLDKAVEDGADFAVVLECEDAAMRARDQLAARKALGELADHLLEIDWDLVVVDECHRAKAPNGAIQRSVRKIAKKAPSVVLQSGTWMPHDPRDVFPPIRMIDEEIFGTAFGPFERLITCFTGPQSNWPDGFKIDPEHKQYDPDLADWFARSVCSVVFVVPELDLGLECAPPQFRSHALPAKVRGLYEQLRDELAIDLDIFSERREVAGGAFEPMEVIPGEGTVLPPNTLVRLLRLAQLASGELPLDDSAERITHNERFELLCDTLADVDEPVVVGCRFKHELRFAERAAAKLGRSYGEISGRRKDGLDREGRMAAVDVAGVQYQSGGVGVDLSRSSLEIMLGHTYNLGEYDQFIGRELRPGQKHTVRLVHLLAEGTCDFNVYEALKHRRNVVSAVVESIARKHTGA